ncbi:MAG: glycosyl hydrolase family 18 protein, partial [Burkholderiales bacterium]|nr:glycosyl hydrolase family 18 protein [Burkholderiales bacterium]
SPTPAPTTTPSPIGFVFSPYKDVGINADWNTYTISTKVTGTTNVVPLLSVLPSNLSTITWSFATGECGAEKWAGITAAQIEPNVAQFANANKNYILSTGGAGGTFTCSTNAGMDAFINRYMSKNLVGIDFDIEAGQSNAEIDALIKQIAYAQSKYPNLRFSFTLATLADSSGTYGSLNSIGQYVVNKALAANLKFYVNLMVMDYGSATSSVCYVTNGACDMAQSAIQAVTNFEHNYPQIKPAYIEVTPMIGDNDVQGETFTMANAQTLANYVITNGLGGFHIWSLDRDTSCPASQKYVSITCNRAPNASVLGFTTLLSNTFN